MNLYIVNQDCEDTIGFDWSIHNWGLELKKMKVNVCIVYLVPSKKHIRIEVVDGIDYFYFPYILSNNQIMNCQEHIKLYNRNIVYLFRLYIKDKSNLLFYLNIEEDNSFIQELKRAFDCKIIVNLDKKQLDWFNRMEYGYLLNVDHIICKSDREKEILMCVYGIDKTKISVIIDILCAEKELKEICESCLRSIDNKIRTLIVTGQSDHHWEVSHMAIKRILENSGLFSVDVAVSPESGEVMSNFKLDFLFYQLVILDYCGDRWPKETENSFLSFVEQGGGVVVYHAASNAFREWKEYNRIIGFGGWGSRDKTDGPYIYLKGGELVYDERSSGCAGSHGIRHEFVLHCGNPDHPITKGLPIEWLHAKDELYDQMRGSGIVKDTLFWSHSDQCMKGSGRDELIMFTVDYGNARIFHTTIGHAGNSLDDNIAMQCTGFQVTLLRGAEWAATGNVTQSIPNDFPTKSSISLRKNYK